LIKEFTGVSSPYEVPEHPDLIVSTGTDSLDDCVRAVLTLIQKRGIYAK
jgi:adenylylsulfate kinase